MRQNEQKLIIPVSDGTWRDHLGRPIAGAWRSNAAPMATQDWLARLEQGMNQGQTALIVAEVIEGLAQGRSCDALARWLTLRLAQRGAVLEPIFAATADSCRMAAAMEDLRPALPWTTAIALAGALVAGREPTETATAQALACDFVDLHAAIDQRDAVAAAAIAQAALAQLPLATVQTWLLRLAAQYPGDGGVCAIAAVKLADLHAATGDLGMDCAYVCLARALALRPEHLGYTQAHPARMAALAPRMAAMADAEDPEKAKIFAETKFRPHVLDGKGDAPFRAAAKALEVGIPRLLLAGSLALAAADRLLRYDPKHDLDDSVLEDRTDVEQLLVLVSAVRQMHGRIPTQDWIALYFFALGLVNASGALDAAQNDRRALPDPAALHQTWDHGPEIAKILTNLHAQRGEQAIAVLRAYLLMVLPEQPLSQQLHEAVLVNCAESPAQQAAAIRLMTAAIDEFHALSANPHRELPLCAALRSLSERKHPPSIAHLAEQALVSRASGWRPQPLVGRGPI